MEVVSTEKDLGIVTVNDTSWKDHILLIAAKANRRLDIVFFFKCLHGHIDLTRSFNYYFSFVTSQTRQACSVLNLKINNNHRTSTFRDFYFNRIANLWNNIPNDVRQAESIDSFKHKLNSFHFKRLFNVFDGDNFRTLK